MPQNTDGVTVSLGSRFGGVHHGGDTGLPSNNIYYCGRQMNQCRCGQCHGRCGPNSGCPCNSCVELLGFKVNRDGLLCKKGKVGGSGGDTGMKPQDLFYCGRQKGECRCRRCDGRCGPTAGCPCNACLVLVGLGRPPTAQPRPPPTPTLTWSTPTTFGFNIQNAVLVGSEAGHKLYVARSSRGAELIPGKYFPDTKAYFVHAGVESDTKLFEVLMDPGKRTRWVTISSMASIPTNAVVGGHSVTGERLYVGRHRHDGADVCGQATDRGLVYGYFCKVHRVVNYEILVCP